jgi:hypothetical protein
MQEIVLKNAKQEPNEILCTLNLVSDEPVLLVLLSCIGITNFLPSVPGCATVRVCCLPKQQLSSIPNIHISPDSFKPWEFTLQQMLAWALEPADEERLLWLFEDGRQDAETWAVASGIAAAAAARSKAGSSAATAFPLAGQSASFDGFSGMQESVQPLVVLPLTVAPLPAEKPVLLKLFDSLSSFGSSVSSMSSSDEGDETSPSSSSSAAAAAEAGMVAAVKELVTPSGELIADMQKERSSSSSGSGGSSSSGSSNGSGNDNSSSGNTTDIGNGSSSSESSETAPASANAGGSWGSVPELLGQLQKKMRAD